MALAVAFFVVLPLQYYLVWIDWYGLYSVFIPVYVFLLLATIAALRQDTNNFMSRVAETQWGLMISVFSLSHVPALLGAEDSRLRGTQLMLIAFLVLDRPIERRAAVRLGQAARPPQDRAGAVAVEDGRGVPRRRGKRHRARRADMVDHAVSPWQAGAMALMINLMGFFGGLVMSAIKRDRGVKDWGWMIEGHGGVLDRLDSVIFAAPVFFHVTRYFWAL